MAAVPTKAQANLDCFMMTDYLESYVNNFKDFSSMETDERQNSTPRFL